MFTPGSKGGNPINFRFLGLPLPSIFIFHYRWKGNDPPSISKSWGMPYIDDLNWDAFPATPKGRGLPLWHFRCECKYNKVDFKRYTCIVFTFMWFPLIISYTKSQNILQSSILLSLLDVKFLTPKPPKNSLFCIFNKEVLAECVVLLVKKADFVLLGPPSGSVPPRISQMHMIWSEML